MRSLGNVRVLNFAGLTPAPLAGLLLADNGAEVLRVDRVKSGPAPSPGVLIRGKSSVRTDIKSTDIRTSLHLIIPRVDVLIRPCVLEKLNLGPEDILLKHDLDCHDPNYLAGSGVLSMLGPSIRVPFEVSSSAKSAREYSCQFCRAGKGQAVEANIVDGVSYLATAPRISTKIPGQWDQPRGENLGNGGYPYYRLYECKDGWDPRTLSPGVGGEDVLRKWTD
ncbi:hypothetical protein N7513_013148 [Penicillium frequentans]|nr:hypothetical protein N7513_013148 [Penicillium glabrum]